MSFNVRVEPSNHQFSAEPGESILDAAERQGIALPYGCRNGMCGSCAGTLVSGSVNYPGEAVDMAQRPEDQCLPCKAVASSDLVLRIHELESAKEVVVRSLPCRVERLERLAQDVMRIHLRLPDGERLQFLAGQYIDFIMPDGRRRAFSIANAPHDDELIELHVRHVPGGEFTDHVFAGMQPGEILNIEAPLGGFYLREESDKPLIFMAGGTGFAPLKAIIEHAFHIGIRRPIHLYWGVRSERDLYLGELAREWAENHEEFRFTPVLSEPDAGWSGRTGWVHEAVVGDYPEMAPFDLYMSGPPVMIFAAKKAFLDAGMDEDAMFSDVFEWAKDSPEQKLDA